MVEFHHLGKAEMETDVVCRMPEWVHKFYTIDYLDIEYDEVTSIPDIDHANMFFHRDKTCFDAEQKIKGDGKTRSSLSNVH